MDLLNKKVTHKAFGVGHIVAWDDSSVEVEFKDEQKKFVFPDAFEKFLVIEDATEAAAVDVIVQQQEAVREEEALQKEKELQHQRKMHELKLEHQRLMKNHKIHDASQMVYWCDKEELQTVFTDWTVFSGIIKSGKNKGNTSKPTRLHQNSAVLLTTLSSDEKEQDRRILGMYMVKERFIGKLSENGIIPAHSVYKIQLTEEEAAQLRFWHYYVDEKNEQKMSWKSGKHRYFNNVWMAQILKDVVAIKTDEEERNVAQKFLMHFCRMNQLIMDDLPEANGALLR